MICPECRGLNLKSSIITLNTTTTLLCSHSYYDDEGEYHHHDPNVTSTRYHCSQGHKFSVESISTCWCGYGKSEVVK